MGWSQFYREKAEERANAAETELTIAKAEIARLTQQVAARDAEIEGRLRGVR